MKCTIFNDRNELYFIPVGFVLVNEVLKFIGVESRFWVGIMFIISVIAVFAYNLIPMRIVLSENELCIKHILIKRIRVAEMDCVNLQEYIARFKGMRIERVRLTIVYHRGDKVYEVDLNDKRSRRKLFGKEKIKRSGLYDLREHLKFYVSKGTAITDIEGGQNETLTE